MGTVYILKYLDDTHCTIRNVLIVLYEMWSLYCVRNVMFMFWSTWTLLWKILKATSILTLYFFPRFFIPWKSGENILGKMGEICFSGEVLFTSKYLRMHVLCKSLNVWSWLVVLAQKKQFLACVPYKAKIITPWHICENWEKKQKQQKIGWTPQSSRSRKITQNH